MSGKRKSHAKLFQTERIGAEKFAASNKRIVEVENDDSMIPNQSGGSGQTGWLAHLKNHWWAVVLISFLSIGALAGGLKYLEEDARRQLVARTNNNGQLAEKEQSLLSTINPFLPNPTPTPQLAKEYIYAGSRMLAVEDAGANAAPPADLAVWRPGSGYWYVMGAGGTIQASQQWGNSSDKAVPGDYDGDGKTDFAVFRASVGTWFIIKSGSSTEEYYYLGTTGDKALTADFDGDGRSDAAVYRADASAHTGTWHIRQSSTNTVVVQQFGVDTDLPAAADYDGDGKADIGVWRGTDKAFYSLRSSNGQFQALTISAAATSALPVSGDYDGDGKADFTVKSGTSWIISYSGSGQTQSVTWQQANDIAVQNDYDGDGKTDIAVWREATGDWYLRNSSTGQLRYEHWGQAGDVPVPSFWRR